MLEKFSANVLKESISANLGNNLDLSLLMSSLDHHFNPSIGATCCALHIQLVCLLPGGILYLFSLSQLLL